MYKVLGAKFTLVILQGVRKSVLERSRQKETSVALDVVPIPGRVLGLHMNTRFEFTLLSTVKSTQ